MQSNYAIERGYTKTGVYATIYKPLKPSGEGLLICPSLNEERLHSVRYLHVLSERLASERGICVARFDYRGSGDSGGLDAKMSFSSLCDDARSLMLELKNTQGVLRLTVMGVRAGALVALNMEVESCILVSPVLRGADFISDLKRARHIRGSLTSSDDAAVEENDFDGVVYSRSFLSELAEIDYKSGEKDAHIIDLNPRGRVSKSASNFKNALAIKAEPFWLSGNSSDPSLLLEELKNFGGNNV